MGEKEEGSKPGEDDRAAGNKGICNIDKQW